MDLSISEMISLGQTIILVGSFIFLFYQAQMIRRDLRLRARYEFFEKLFTLDRFLIDHPKVAEPFAFIPAWGANERQILFHYVLNMFELVNDMRIEGIIVDVDWAPWKKFLQETMKSKEFREFWQSIRDSNVYSEPLQNLVDEAAREALKSS